MLPVACMFSNGLPFPRAGLSVRSAAAGEVDVGGRVDARDDAAAEGLGEVAESGLVEAACPLSVDVAIEPVTMPDGPTAMGTTTCTVRPLLSVVVRVKVERMVLVSS
jgi:hypothetical protein